MQRHALWTCGLAALGGAGWMLWPSQAPPTPSTPVPDTVSYRIRLGIGDNGPTAWDGSARVSTGRVSDVQGWRFAANDAVNGSSWKMETHRSAPAPLAALRGEPGPMIENGLLVALENSGERATVTIETRQGTFSFVTGEIPFAVSRAFLNGRAAVDRVPSTRALTVSDEEDDFPAVFQTPGEVLATFVRFTHGDRNFAFTAAPTGGFTNFDFLSRPAGGDQVILKRYSKSRRVWSEEIPVSAPGQDVMRTAAAVDGRGRTWVIWSANQQGNFDLFARTLDSGRWSGEIRITRDPGSDLNPVAATDSNGRVWVAWQAFRNGNLEILAAAQNGDSFTPETLVSQSRASDWDPTIAAGPGGRIAIAWDTYEKGDYDVYFRRLRFDRTVRSEPPVAVAAGPGFDVRASAAFDPKGRLWIAYETSRPGWGKDWGNHEESGVPLFQFHNIALKCFDGNSAFTPSDRIEQALPMSPRELYNLPRAQSGTSTLGTGERPLNSFPRLAIDSNGAVFLAYRMGSPVLVRTQRAGSVGAVYFEQVLYHGGAGWTGPVSVPNTDGVIDNRPALAAVAPGRLLMVSGMDHRGMELSGAARGKSDGFQHDLYAAEMRFDPRPAGIALTPLPSETAGPPGADSKAEADQAAMMRGYTASLGPNRFRLLRGEFHRHTEFSGDGGRDGPIVDAYRYLIDAAAMDWAGCCDHDYGAGREYTWWIAQKLTDAYHLKGRFTTMFSYERSVRYPEGHRNVVFVNRGIRVLPRLPKMEEDSPPVPAPDTQMLYKYLRLYDGIASLHTSATDQGTDWRDNDPALEPLVEIYQGIRYSYERPDGPRNNVGKPSDAQYRGAGFVSEALKKGYRLGFQSSSDHIATHMSYCNLWVRDPTREGVMEALKARRVYGSTDNILADVRCGAHFMGEEFTVREAPVLSIRLQGTAAFAKVHVIKDGEYAYTIEPRTSAVNTSWRDTAAVAGKTSYYYVRGEQVNGEIVWVSPMWIRYQP